jgi:hypothetical protein
MALSNEPLLVYRIQKQSTNGPVYVEKDANNYTPELRHCWYGNPFTLNITTNMRIILPFLQLNPLPLFPSYHAGKQACV